MDPIRTVFLGTAELARRSLEGLAQCPRVDVLGVISQPDKAQGRKLKMTPTPVKAAGLDFGFPIWQPVRLRNDLKLMDRLKDLDLDVIVVAAYGQLLPDWLLEIPKHGCVNVHTSLLPKYRGAAPIQWAILNGDRETGITLMKMDAGLDTGPMIAQRKTPIQPDETAGALHDRLAQLGVSFLVETLPSYIGGSLPLKPQDNAESTHARKLSKADASIDWAQPAATLHNQVRGLNPWPGTSSHLKRGDDSVLIKFWSSELGSKEHAHPPGTVMTASQKGIEIACGTGSLLMTWLQREGGKRLEAGPFLSGFPLEKGDHFAQAP